ncbi:hypothetical protein WDU94_012119 [Cyamophila willieti]
MGLAPCTCNGGPQIPVECSTVHKTAQITKTTLYGYEHHEEKGHKLFDYKKHVLAALFQAVKAITGGVVALKGQVLKIGGHLITWKGKFLVKKGDQISDFGKEVATKALLSPPTVHHHHTVYSAPTSFGSSAYASAQASHSSSHANDIYHHHAAPHHYVAPAYSAPTPTYSAPSGGASYPYAPSGVAEYDYNRDFGSKVTRAVSPSTQTGTAQNTLNNDQLHAGLLILKPIQVPKDHPSKYQYAQQALLKQTGLSGISINTAGNTGMNYNVGSYTPQSNSYQGQSNYQNQLNNYQTQSNSYQLPSDSYKSPSNSYQVPITSYGTPSPAISQFIKVPSSAGSEYRSSFPALAPTPLSDAKLPEESSPFDFLYKKNKKSSVSQTSQERLDTKSAESEINENALSALNVLYQQTEAQNKDQRETRHTPEEPLNDETLKKILDALFSAKDKKSKAESEGSSDPSASENFKTVA